MRVDQSAVDARLNAMNRINAVLETLPADDCCAVIRALAEVHHVRVEPDVPEWIEEEITR